MRERAPGGPWVVSAWLLHGFRVAPAWLPRGSRVAPMWLPCDSRVALMCPAWLNIVISRYGGVHGRDRTD